MGALRLLLQIHKNFPLPAFKLWIDSEKSVEGRFCATVVCLPVKIHCVTTDSLWDFLCFRSFHSKTG